MFGFDLFTLLIVVAIIVAAGTVLYELVWGKSEIKVDAGDVTIGCAGLQDPMLGVAAYTAGTASKSKNGCGCNDCDCGSIKTSSDVDMIDPRNVTKK
jgi:hypothetical protein